MKRLHGKILQSCWGRLFWSLADISFVVCWLFQCITNFAQRWASRYWNRIFVSCLGLGNGKRFVGKWTYWVSASGNCMFSVLPNNLSSYSLKNSIVSSESLAYRSRLLEPALGQVRVWLFAYYAKKWPSWAWRNCKSFSSKLIKMSISNMFCCLDWKAMKSC